MNSKKVNNVVSVDELYAIFVTGIGTKPVKLNYSGGKVAQPYCGFDDFSVNVKKTGYNVYMNDINRDICKLVDKKLVATKNECDTTKKQLRCNLIKFDNIETLKKCIEKVTENKLATL